MTKPISEVIKKRMSFHDKRYWANDNISEFIHKGDKELLKEELTEKFREVLKSMIIDIDTDPNSKETPERLARMYIDEIMCGRYDNPPKVTAFPNKGEDAYSGMLVVRAEIDSVCSHHHQPVEGTAFIGIIPDAKVIGLSKYVRIAQWAARRGTLQEQLAVEIANLIKLHTASPDVAVYIEAEHGCCTNRGIQAHSSLTQTTVVHGKFKELDSVKQEFFNQIKLQKAT